jgi:uncharacterized membrane protein YkvA (DUF1232 family)
MKISGVKAVLSGSDIMSILDDFLDVEGLKIDNIDLQELAVITGSYTKGTVFPFIVKIGFGNVVDNVVSIKIFDVKIHKLNVFSFIKNMALKKFLKDFSEFGILVDKDNVSLDLTMVNRLIPYVYFKLESLEIVDGHVEAQFKELIYAKNKEGEKPEKKPEEGLKKKIYGKYAKIRKTIISKVPSKYQKFFQYALMIPDIIALLWRLLKDERVSAKAKMMVTGMLLYVANPIDLLPDFIPVIGKMDDVAIAFYGLNSIINEVPEEIVLENWQGEDNIILVVKDAVSYITNTVGGRNAAKILDVVREIMRKGSVTRNYHEFELNMNKYKEQNYAK